MQASAGIDPEQRRTQGIGAGTGDVCAGDGERAAMQRGLCGAEGVDIAATGDTDAVGVVAGNGELSVAAGGVGENLGVSAGCGIVDKVQL